MKRARLLLGLGLFWVASGCGASTRRAAGEPSTAVAQNDEDLGPAVIEFADHEVEVVAALARGDPSIAARFGLNPSLGDEAEPRAEPHANWFSSRERGGALDDAERALAGWVVPSRIVRGVSPRARALRLERELVARMVKEERFRYEHERQLPRGGSDLVHAAVLAYRAAPATDARRQHEWGIGRRLEEIRASLRNAPLPSLEADELDDALDPLEKLGLPGISGTLTALRLELGDRKRRARRGRPIPPSSNDSSLRTSVRSRHS